MRRENIAYTLVVAWAARVFLYQPFNMLSRFSIQRPFLFGSESKLGDVTFSALARGVQENSGS
jgi:hypothetical protein